MGVAADGSAERARPNPNAVSVPNLRITPVAAAFNVNPMRMFIGLSD